MCGPEIVGAPLPGTHLQVRKAGSDQILLCLNPNGRQTQVAKAKPMDSPMRHAARQQTAVWGNG